MSKNVQWCLVTIVSFFLGALLVPQLPVAKAQQDAAKGPRWSHGLDLKCRKGGETDFTKTTAKYGIEVFVDENNGNLIYISETGAIAVVARK